MNKDKYSFNLCNLACDKKGGVLQSSVLAFINDHESNKIELIEGD